MISPTLVSFTPLFVVSFTPFMISALATFFYYAGTMPASLHPHPTRVDIDMLSHGCRRRKRERRHQQQSRRCLHCHRDLPCIKRNKARNQIKFFISSDAEQIRECTWKRSGGFECAFGALTVAPQSQRTLPGQRLLTRAHRAILVASTGALMIRSTPSWLSGDLLANRHGRRRNVCDLPHVQKSHDHNLHGAHKTVHAHQNSHADRRRRGGHRIRRDRGNDHSHDLEQRPGLRAIRSRYRLPGRTVRRSGPL